MTLTTALSPSFALEPHTITQALKDPKWRQAMNDEFDALVWNGTWELVPSTPLQNLVGCKWVFRIKRLADGFVDRYKARLVAKGFINGLVWIIMTLLVPLLSQPQSALF